jgi:hypothetical protein
MRKLQRRIVSGARVMFDPRTTAEANHNRDMTNYVTKEKSLRVDRFWDRKRKEQQGK